MSLGLSIFLSALFLGIIALVIATKDRWNWKTIILWPLSIIWGLAILGGLGAFIYSLIPSTPKVQESFWEISLDMPKPDIKFIKGEPSEVEGEDLWAYKIKRQYSDDWSLYQIGFKQDKVRYVLYAGSDWLSSPELQGIRLNATYSEVRQRLGKPSQASSSDDELRRIFSYDAYHVFFIMKENKVSSYGIYNPESGPLEFAEDKEIGKQPKKE